MISESKNTKTSLQFGPKPTLTAAPRKEIQRQHYFIENKENSQS
jgi:hypothetical protein